MFASRGIRSTMRCATIGKKLLVSMPRHSDLARTAERALRLRQVNFLHVWQVASALEPLCAALAAEAVTEEELEALERNLERTETVVAGGGDFPVTRPDGVEVIDALYRLRTDDGVTIIIHNKGLSYGGSGRDGWHYRLAPEFIAPKGKYDWLNRALFISTLVDVPAAITISGTLA